LRIEHNNPLLDLSRQLRFPPSARPRRAKRPALTRGGKFGNIMAKASQLSHLAVAGDPAADLILLCDHASNALPAQYGSLGLPRHEFHRHIAYDIGAYDVTLGLARRLNSPALLTAFSRLLIDPNRGLDDPTLIMKVSDGAVVPGNAGIDEGERNSRIENYWMPYQQAIAQRIDAALALGIVPALVSIHSFNPHWKGKPRPWHIGILWDRDPRLAQLMLAGLREHADLIVGDNEPYHGALEGDTLNTHATRRGLAHALVELRQDLIDTKSGVDEWVERLARLLEAIRNDPILHETRFY
jgi:predicted N-formylglutamate amidohydrolase